ncbi:kinesin heavy chain [Spatholobus suberectus]|nr:kinesin heavy chain [Spatholobus suberectus]
MIPACFSQPNTPSSSSRSSTQVPQNVVTSIYQTQLCNSPTNLTLTWSRTLLSHSLTIYAPHTFSITITLNPSTFSFFRTRPGSKSIYLTRSHKRSQKIKLLWDFSGALFGTQNSAEPDSCFYLAICCYGRVEFFLGDLILPVQLSTHQPGDQTLVSRREHVFGGTSYVSRGEFMGSKREIEIELCNGEVLRVKVDGQVCLVVKRLAWKFRGNEKIFVDGVEVEFYWDVLSWVVNSENGNGNGHGVFVFQVGDGGAVWPEMVGPEKKLMKKRLVGPTTAPSIGTMLPSPSGSGVLQWAEESSDGGRSSCSSSTRSCGSSNGGFSLLLYAWRRD